MIQRCPTCWNEIDNCGEDGTVKCSLCDAVVPVQRPRRYAPIVKRERLKDPWVRQLLGFFAVFGLIVLGCSGSIGFLVYDHVAQPTFEPYASSEGRFTLDFPGKPHRANPTTYTPAGPVTFPAVILERAVPSEAYMIAWVDIPPVRMAAGADAILDDACRGAGAYNGAVEKELSREPITCSGHRGYDVVYAVKGMQGKGMLRVVLARSRLYLLFVGGNFIQTDSTRARQFFDSLKIY